MLQRVAAAPPKEEHKQGGQTALLAESRPKALGESVLKSAVAVSHRQQEWGVDGEWSYDFSDLGYACETCSPTPTKPEPEAGHTFTRPDGADADSGTGHSSTSSGGGDTRRCVLRASVDRVLGASKLPFRVLDLGAGSGGWLLQAKRELEDHLGASSPAAIHLHGITGDTSTPEIQTLDHHTSAGETRDRGGEFEIELEHFQQIGIEVFPPRLGERCAQHFARTVGAALLVPQGGSGGSDRSAGGKLGYDLIVSSWTFCHLVDPLATLEIWSGALAVDGELYVNDIDFGVTFEGEVATATGYGAAALGGADAEKRMGRAFEALNTKGMQAGAFSITFVADKDYRTAVKVKRLSAAPIRFAPVVGYRDGESGRGGGGALYVVKG